MDFRLKNKKIYVIAIIIIILIAIITIVGIKNNKLKSQLKNAEHGITIKDNVVMYKKSNEKGKNRNLEIGTDIYILEEVTSKTGKNLYKIKANDNIGYIEKADVGTFKKSEEKKSLMVDVSKFNMQNNFKTIGEFKAFIINNNIKYVYIKAGGRGYGSAGVMYTDPKAKDYAEACEFLNIPFGYYFLDEALNSDEIDEEVNFIKNFLKENSYKNNTLPVSIDVEKHAENGRADNIWDTRYILVNELTKKLDENGINSIIYSNADLANKYLGGVDKKLWLAYYPNVNEIPNYWYSQTTQPGALNKSIITKMVAWQLTENGIKNTIDEKIDISIVYSKFFENG